MKKPTVLLLMSLLVTSALADVQVYIQQANGKAWLKYQCTAGETVRAFALDVTVDAGSILGVGDFFRGPSTDTAQGYGIFPASFRDHINAVPGTNLDWNASGYSPLANPADNPGGTLPGLNSWGVTLEFGALWDPNVPTAIPPPAGTLCSLRISQQATVSVRPNSARGGVVATEPDVLLGTTYSGALVQPPEITGLSLADGLLRITFAGGELETAVTPTGPWTATGDTNGVYTESENAGDIKKFYRVLGQ